MSQERSFLGKYKIQAFTPCFAAFHSVAYHLQEMIPKGMILQDNCSSHSQCIEGDTSDVKQGKHHYSSDAHQTTLFADQAMNRTVR